MLQFGVQGLNSKFATRHVTSARTGGHGVLRSVGNGRLVAYVPLVTHICHSRVVHLWTHL